MPPCARISLELLESIARERLGATSALVREDLLRIESLAADLLPTEQFPEDWIIFRITGQQRIVRRPALISGVRLLHDLSALSERLSQQARLEKTPDVTDMSVLAARWNVNKKTIDRYRRQGLLAQRLLAEDGKPRICFTPAAIMRFEEIRQKDLATAGTFARIDETTKQKILRWAAAYRRRLNWSLNRVAGRISQRTGRSREAVRLILQSQQRHQLRARKDATFAEPAPLTAIQQKVILRAMIRGGDPGDLARRYKKPLGSIQRAWSIARAQQLRGLQLPAPPPTLPVSDSAAVLAAAPVISGLAVTPETDLAAFVATARRPSVPIGVEETARIAAYRELVVRAATTISGLDRSFPRSTHIDEAMTNLRWAARLKARLVAAQFRLIVQNLEAGLGLGLDMIRSAPLRRLLQEAIHAASDTVDTHAFLQASSRGRLAAPVGLAINRLAARWQREHGHELGIAMESQTSRATTRLSPGIPFADWTRSIATWQHVVEPDHRLRAAISAIPASDRALLVLRFGWGDEPPRTLIECAAKLGVSSIKIARLERAALGKAYLALVQRDQT